MDTTRIRLVPSRSLWAIVFLLLFYIAGIAALTLSVPDCGCGPSQKTNPVAGLLASLCLPALLIAWTRIAFREADQDGLRWRTLFKTRFASWADVDDYYLTSPSGERTAARRAVVKTKIGDFIINSDWFGDVEGLRAMVRERAVNARAKSWERLGMRRDIDWPQEHGYDTTDNRAMSVVMPLLLMAVVALWAWMLWSKIPRSFTDPGFGWTIASLLIASFLPLAMIVPIFYLWRIAREASARRQDRVVVSREGLSLLQPGKTTRIAWNDVERFYIDSTNTRSLKGWPFYVVESENDRIEFLQSIQNFAVLTAVIVREAAVAARQDRWLNNAALRENLDRCASERTVDASGRTRRLFHYRTRSMRRAILYGVALGATLTLPALMGRLGSIDPVAFSDLYFAGFPTILLWTIWRYRTAGIVTTSSGITERALFGSRTLSWESIVGCRVVGEEYVPRMILTGASGNQIRFWLSICDVAELQREIRRRAPQTEFNRGKKQEA